MTAFTYRPGDRAALAAGYRRIAELIDAGTLPIPSVPEIHLFVYDAEQAVEIQAALGGGWRPFQPAVAGDYRVAQGMCHGLPVDLWVGNDAVPVKAAPVTVERRSAA